MTNLMIILFNLVKGFWTLNRQYMNSLRIFLSVTRGSIFFKFVGLGCLFNLIYNVIYVKGLNEIIIIGVVICVLTFVSERYIFKKLQMNSLFVQFIKRCVIYLFIITIIIITDMVFGLNIFDSIIYCDSTDDDSNNLQNPSTSSTQNTPSTSSTQNTPSTSSTQNTPSTSSTDQKESTLDKVNKVGKEISSNLAKFGENYIPYSVGGTLGAATMKHTVGGSMGQRVAATVATATLGVAGTALSGSMVKGINNAIADSAS